MKTLRSSGKKAVGALISLWLAAYFSTLRADGSVVEIPLPAGGTAQMVSYESFLIDKSFVSQKMYRAFDPTYIQRLKELCDECPVVDIEASQRDAYCKWAGKRLPAKEELEIAGIREEAVFRCAWDKDILNQATPSKDIDEVFNPGKSVGQIKGGTCDPVD